MGHNYSKPSFLRFSSHSQTSASLSPHPMPPEQLPHDYLPPLEEQENQNEEQSEQTVPESESPRDEEVVNDSSSVSDCQTMRTTCFRKPTPTKPTREPTSCKRRLFEKNAGDESPEKKKKKMARVVNGRLWSEEDEVVILEGLMDFQSKNRADPYPDMGEFHELIKQSLSFDASKNQFLDKIRKLKRKYVNNVEKGNKLAVFLSKPHEQECFELSKRIWGGDIAFGGGSGASCTRARKSVKKLNDSVALHQEKGKEVVLGEKVKELEKKWQIWRADEVALRLRQDELIEDQKKLMLDSIKASKE